MRLVRPQQIVGVLHPFGNAGEAQHRSQVIGRQEFGKRGVVDIGVNRHEASTPRL